MKPQDEVLKKLKPFANPKQTKVVTQDMNFFPGLQLKMLGLRVGQIRTVEKTEFSFYEKPFDKIVVTWDKIWKQTNVYEVRSCAAIYLQKNTTSLKLKHWRILKTWAKTLDNWEHSDRLSGVYNELLNNFPNKIYPQLKKWNSSKNPWERRQSLVSLFFYYKPNRLALPINKILPLVKNLLKDNHLYVQKGVGWCLRETGHVYPKQTWEFLKKHVKNISPVAWQASTEKLSKIKKAELKILRKR